LAKAEVRLSAQRIYQDLVEEKGFTDSYQSVKRFVVRIIRAAWGVGDSGRGNAAEDSLVFHTKSEKQGLSLSASWGASAMARSIPPKPPRIIANLQFYSYWANSLL
jgi:hypothetical protein